ncbi:uncharacterized protein FYW47_016631 [Aplochiton taeniatus]
MSREAGYQRGMRYTYRYTTTIATTLHGSNSGRNGMALDCVVDIDVVGKCQLMLQIRNPQIKRLSPQKEHSVQRLKSLRVKPNWNVATVFFLNVILCSDRRLA